MTHRKLTRYIDRYIDTYIYSYTHTYIHTNRSEEMSNSLVTYSAKFLHWVLRVFWAVSSSLLQLSSSFWTKFSPSGTHHHREGILSFKAKRLSSLFRVTGCGSGPGRSPGFQPNDLFTTLLFFSLPCGKPTVKGRELHIFLSPSLTLSPSIPGSGFSLLLSFPWTFLPFVPHFFLVHFQSSTFSSFSV